MDLSNFQPPESPCLLVSLGSAVCRQLHANNKAQADSGLRANPGLQHEGASQPELQAVLRP